MNKYLIFLLIAMFIGTNINSVLGVNIIDKQNYNKKIQNLLFLNEFDEHPDYYNITIYRFHGNTYEEVIKQVSYEDAMKIK